MEGGSSHRPSLAIIVLWQLSALVAVDDVGGGKP